MKKIITLFCFIAGVQTVFAQNSTADSLRTVLSKTSKPIERFHLINMILESVNSTSGKTDSADCITLLQIAQQLHNDSLLATSYNWIGLYFLIDKGENVTSLEYFFKAIPLAEETGDKRRISSIYFDIALVYLNLGNKEDILKYTLKGEASLPENSHPLYSYMLCQFQRNIATYFLLNNQPDSALQYAQALSATSRKAKSQLFEYHSYYLNGAAHAVAGETGMAEIYFKKALALASSINNNAAILRFSFHYIPYLFRNGRFAEVKEQAHQLLLLGKEYNNNNLKLYGTGFMRQVFDSLRNKDSAYYYSRMEAELNARIFSQNNINKMQALSFNEQIRKIEEEARLEEAKQQRRQNIQYALIAIGIIVLFTLYLLLSRSFITNTKLIEFFGIVALLIVFEFLNLLLHPFLERITNHSPVLMLLALVCIAALLVPLHHRVEKWATNKLVEKNKKIRLAAAKKTIEQLEK
jgi:hypothetical protein